MTVSILPKGSTFVRIAIAKAIAKGDDLGAAEFAAARWGEGSPTVRLLKAAVPAGSTDNPAYSALYGELTQAAAEFFGLVRQVSIVGRLAGIRRVPLRTPILSQTAGVSAAWVREGKPIPVQSLEFARDSLPALSLAAITVTTDELLRFADPQAEATIRGDLVQAIADASDIAFIDPANAGVEDEQPASITNGVTPITSTGNFKADLERLVAGFNGDLTRAYLVARPEMLVQVSGADFPNVGARGGEIAGIPTIASRNVPLAGGDYQMALVDPTGISWGADDGAAEIAISRQASIQLNDTPVADASANMVSLWQVNAVAIRALLRENWRETRPGSVALLTGVAPAEAA